MNQPQSNYLYYGNDAIKEFRTSGRTCKPSGFDEYDALTGYVERTYTKTWRDADGNLWRKTTTIVNLGRPDRGVPVDPDAQLAPAPLNSMRDYDGESSLAVRQSKSKARHSMAQIVMSAYMHKHGATSVEELARHVNMQKEWVRLHLLEREGKVYCRIWVNQRHCLWGLVNVHDKDAP